jgi:organic radical activating enzyme
MLGKNKVEEHTDNPAIFEVNSVFQTIQGEGPLSGHAATFVRLAGCNLRCSWCDTEFEKRTFWGVESLSDRVEGMTRPGGLVVITGGEPCRQEISSLILSLSDRERRVQIETAGTIWRNGLEECTVVVSPKTHKIDPRIEALQPSYKYVIRATDNFTDRGFPITNTQDDRGRKVALAEPHPNHPTSDIYLTPCDEGPLNHVANQANRAKVVELAMKYGYVAQLQIHKLLGLP